MPPCTLFAAWGMSPKGVHVGWAMLALLSQRQCWHWLSNVGIGIGISCLVLFYFSCIPSCLVPCYFFHILFHSSLLLCDIHFSSFLASFCMHSCIVLLSFSCILSCLVPCYFSRILSWQVPCYFCYMFSCLVHCYLCKFHYLIPWKLSCMPSWVVLSAFLAHWLP